MDATPYFTAFFLCCTQFAIGQSKNDLQEHNLIGSVKSVAESQYDNKEFLYGTCGGGKIFPKFEYAVPKEDEDGTLLELAFYDKGDSVAMQRSYSYSTAGTLSAEKKKEIIVTRHGILYGNSYIYKYDADDCMTEQDYYKRRDSLADNDSLVNAEFFAKKVFTRKTVTEYDTAGNYTVINHCNKNDSITNREAKRNMAAVMQDIATSDSISRCRYIVGHGDAAYGKLVYVYDDRHHKLEVDFYRDSNSRKVPLITNKFDSLGRLLATVQRSQDNDLLDSVVNTYNRNGHTGSRYIWNKGYNLNQRMVYDKQGYNLTERTVFDKRGNDVRGEAFDKKGRLTYGHVKRYDKDENLLYEYSWNIYLGSCEISFAKYQDFDSKGNWQRKESWAAEGSRVSYFERKITYY